MSEFFNRLFRPTQRPSIFRADQSSASSVGRVLAGLVVCLAVTALLSSERLVAMAERQEFGPSRDRWIAAAETVDAVAARLAMDRPAAAINTALGRTETDPADVVLGELADEPEAPPATAVTTTEPPPTTEVSATSTTIAATTTTAPIPTTEAPPAILGDVDVNNPLRIWTGGDSLGEYVGSELLYRVADPDLTNVELDFTISTGLARPDYYDWPGRLSEVMQADDRPNVVVFMVGGNDDQDLRVDGERVEIGTPEWISGYAERVATMMDIAAYSDVQMLWINLPPMRDGRRDTISADINSVLAAEADQRSWVQVIDIVDMFTGPEGGYEQFIDAPDGSATRNARANDGVHITRAASNWVAELVWATIETQWRFDELTTATTAPEATTSTTTAVPSTVISSTVVPSTVVPSTVTDDVTSTTGS